MKGLLGGGVNCLRRSFENQGWTVYQSSDWFHRDRKGDSWRQFWGWLKGGPGTQIILQAESDQLERTGEARSRYFNVPVSCGQSRVYGT